MPSATIRTTLSASETNSDVLSAQRIRKIPLNVRRVLVRLYETGADGSGTTIAAGDLQSAAYVGDQTPRYLSAVSTQNRVPIVPEDKIAEFMMDGGEELTFEVVNNSTGARTHFLTVQIDQVQ